MKKLLPLVGALALTLTAGCAGVRDSNGTFVAHAEAFRVIGIALPGDDQQAALDQVPAGATITNVNASSADWTSFFGILGNILGVSGTQIGGTK